MLNNIGPTQALNTPGEHSDRTQYSYNVPEAKSGGVKFGVRMPVYCHAPEGTRLPCG